MTPETQTNIPIKITNVETIPIKGTRGYPAWVLVRIQTDQGIEGMGEGFTWSGHATTIRSHVEMIGQQLVGTNPLEIQAFLTKFLPMATDRNGFAAISAIEIALWDVLGQVAGLPVYALLGGQVREKIPLYANHGIFGGAKSWEECVERIVGAKESGFGMFKWDPFSGQGTPEPAELNAQIQKVEMVRAAVGPDYPLAIDAHNRFSVEGAIMAAQALEPLNILFFEAPTEDKPELVQKVAEATEIPLATGELTCTRKEAKALLDSGVLNVFQPEVGTNGGILESAKTAALAETYDVKIATHNWCGPIVTRAVSHLCAAIPNLLYQEYASTAPQDEWEQDLLEPATQIKNGHIILSDEAGLGSKLNEKLLTSRRLD
ncbi:MAG: mandelate racemase/muconate lactonizing enzyme family protein [Chloroflexota bacterium]